jgi:phage/plasmid-like protein (TIGR03299 family)
MIETMVRSDATAQSWHGREHVIPADAAFDDWFDASGLNYKALRSKVRYCTARDPQVSDFLEMPSRHVLFRGDTLAPLAVVGEDYKVVQPRQVLEFFRDLCDTNKLTMDTAGVLAGGKRVWALARTGAEVKIAGSDLVKAYILLATSYYTTMATIAKPTSVRVVCNNTLTMAYNNAEASIRVPHSAEFRPEQVKLDLGLIDSAFDEVRDLPIPADLTRKPALKPNPLSVNVEVTFELRAIALDASF